MLETTLGFQTHKDTGEQTPTLSRRRAARAWAKDIIDPEIHYARVHLEQLIKRGAALEEQLRTQIPNSSEARELAEQLATCEIEEAQSAEILQAVFQSQQGLDGDDSSIERSMQDIVLREAIKANAAIDLQLKNAQTGIRAYLSQCDSTTIIVALLVPAISSRLPPWMKDQMELNISQAHALSGIDEKIQQAIGLGLLPSDDITQSRIVQLQNKLSNLLRKPIKEILHSHQQ